MLDADELQWMRYDLLSTIAYFGVGARSDGTLATNTSSWNGWVSPAMTGVINAAHARGVKVVVSITMMAWDGGAQMAALLGNMTARTNLVNAIVATVRARNADGVNLDFEPVAVAQRAQYTSFVRQLKAGLVAGGVRSYLTVCTTGGAATWATGYDLPALIAPGAADAIFVMGYDYSWSGSARAGGVAPMSSPYIVDVGDSINDYLAVVPAGKIIWGAPYYGRTWRTTSSALNATTVSGAAGSSAAYYYTANLGLSAQHGRLWDAVGKVPWFRYYNSAVSSWVQGYYEDAQSLTYKWDMVNQRGLAGAGIWHLLMDEGRSELWNLLARKFKTDSDPPTGGIGPLPSVVDGLGVRVGWRAIDVGSAVASYWVQVRDRAGGTWSTLTTNTTATSMTFAGQAGHRYEFRVSAIDTRGNRQPWTSSALDPGVNLAVGGFGTVTSDTLNVRAGAGTGFGVLDVLPAGSRVAILAGPIAAGGYNWYQAQFKFAEWPSAEYPRIGWIAAGSGGAAYVVPAPAPTVTTLQPAVGAYTVTARTFSPDGNGVLDTTGVTYTLAQPASVVTLEVVNSAGGVVRSQSLGAQPAGPGSATWDGHVGSPTGAWAGAGTYLLRLRVTDAGGAHVMPMPVVDAWVLAAWGVTADLAPPTVTSRSPQGSTTTLSPTVSATLSEAVTGVQATSLSVVDEVTGAPAAGSAAYDPTTRRVSFTPAAPLQVGHLYRATLAGGLQDTVGNQSAGTSWLFATAPASGRAVRLAGADRYGTAAAISAATFSPGVPAAVIAAGTTFADALAGAAAAAHVGGPLLLVSPSAIPPATAAELTRLRPAHLYVLGGPATVSAGVVSGLGAYTRPATGAVTRLAGVDRYATAAAVSAALFPAGADSVLVATGQNFPDGLAAGAAAGELGVPVLLVTATAIPPATATELARLGPDRIVVIGGTGAVSNGVLAALDAYAAVSVERVAAADRYATAAAVSTRFFGAGAPVAFAATGVNFPDALAAGAAAAAWGGPLLLVKLTSLPSSTAVEISRLDPEAVFAAGGTGAVSLSVLGALGAAAGP